jgi:putative redox protein
VDSGVPVVVKWVEGLKFVVEDDAGHAIVVDASRDAGGEGRGFTPGRLLLGSVAACSAMDIVAILGRKRQRLDRLRVEISGEQNEDYPRYYKRMHMKYVVEGDVAEEALREAIGLSMDRYCSVGATVAGRAQITTSYEIVRKR